MWNFSRAISDLASSGRSLAAVLIELIAEVRKSNHLKRLEQAQRSKLIGLLSELLKRLRDIPDPGPISLLVTGENGTMLNFKINLPALPADPGDIVSGELKLKIGDADEQTIGTSKDQTVVDGLSGEQGQQVVASFAYLDDADPPNRSVHPSTIDVVLNDTIPPADPGALGLEVTAEISPPAVG